MFSRCDATVFTLQMQSLGDLVRGVTITDQLENFQLAVAQC